MTIKSIERWFKAAVPEPYRRELSVQAGCHIEEFVEWLTAMHLAPPHDIMHIDALAEKLKSGAKQVPVDFDREAYLDALADQIVTVIGLAYMAGMDIAGALAEVDRANWSKFEDGAPVFADGGKIAKGKNYTPPDLSPFVNVEPGETSTREQILREAMSIVCTGRPGEYGALENNFGTIAQFWSSYLGIEVKPHDVGAMMVLFKAARIKANPSKRDSWVDAAGYAACGFEVVP